MTALSRDALAEALVRHQIQYNHSNPYLCTCGWEPSGPPLAFVDRQRQHLRHLVDSIMALARTEREVKAEALEDLAADPGTNPWERRWLREEATNLRAES